MDNEMALKITGAIEHLKGLIDPECSIYSVDLDTGQVPVEAIQAEQLRLESMLGPSVLK